MIKFFIHALILSIVCSTAPAVASPPLERAFVSLPDSARPGVYWYFMDGNQDREAMTADLEAMRKAGLRKAVFLEVNLNMLRGPVDFMSEKWQENFAHAVQTADRLGIEIILGTGPGWAGSGGPWVEPADSMQHLCSSFVSVAGPGAFALKLPVPPVRKPSAFAGLTPELAKKRDQWHADVAVLAFPTPEQTAPPDLLDVKALYETQPYSSWKHVPRYIPSLADYPAAPAKAVIDPARILDLTDRLRPDGLLDWEVPAGNWTVMRFAARNNGVTSRPAPTPGHGFETDKFNPQAFARHFKQFHQKLLDRVGPRRPGRGLSALHLDSWEMSSQNWTGEFRNEFKKRRGYDPQPYLPAYAGLLTGSREITERFLWDLRKTAQELVLENYAGVIRQHAHENGLYYSSQFYDMNPAGDLDLGSVADVPSCEFWAEVNDTLYSVIEGASIAHTMGRPVLRAESFTAMNGYRQSPPAMKNQTDWALGMGINDFIIHTFQHQPLGLDGPKPGMTFAVHGINWHRNQTFWPMVAPYHDYLARCGQMLRQGVSVADILYLTPEGAPHIFEPPQDAMQGNGLLREKKSYGFDAVSPRILMARAKAEQGRVAFEGGTSYRVLVLPRQETMTPELLAKIESLVSQGITVIGNPPRKSPSLTNHPKCDQQVLALAERVWGGDGVAAQAAERRHGKGLVIRDAVTEPVGLLARQAQWIWMDEGKSGVYAPGGTTRYFRNTIAVDPQRSLRAAMAFAAADNEFVLYLNGEEAAAGNDFNKPVGADIKKLLKAGDNKLTVKAVNSGSTPNPAGLIVTVVLHYTDGSSTVVSSDGTWKVALDESAVEYPVRVLGPGTMAPWNLKAPGNSLYPDYKATTEWLQGKGIPPAFTSTGPVRYHQRRTDERDIFFVANREARQIEANAVFRTDGCAPELWHPVTGELRPLPQFTVENETISVPLEFAPQESYFVVFNRKAPRTAPASPAGNFSRGAILATLKGPYTVEFDPVWGGPDKPVVFETLQLWNQHADEGVRYYSGEAIYRTTFDAPAIKESRIYLDLGVVHKMARVKLNGKDLGILWTPPYRVDVGGALRASGNQLEVTVVNTWVNRLVGDMQPGNKDVRKLVWENGMMGRHPHSAGRYTFSTNSGVEAKTPLQDSGLLGPVTLVLQ